MGYFQTETKRRKTKQMDRQQQLVLEFQKGIESKPNAPSCIAPFPLMQVVEVRRKLIKEEFNELMVAMDQGNFPDAIDALIDLQYVIAGTFVAWGVDSQPFFELVHKANMAKLDGGYFNEAGKFVKPAGWKAPDIAGELVRQMVAASDARQQLVEDGA